MGLLSNENFMQHGFLEMILQMFGMADDAGVFTGLARSTYWTQDELLRGNFTELATGITDVIV